MASVTMPQLGESVAEGTIGRWLKQVGDVVAKDEPLVEIITDKVTAEIPSPFAGTLVAIDAAEGQTVPVQAPIAEIRIAETAAASDELAEEPPVASGTRDLPLSNGERSDILRYAVGSAAASNARPERGANPRTTPAVRRLLREYGLSPAQVIAAGPGGRITREDVLAAAHQPPPVSVATAPALTERAVERTGPPPGDAASSAPTGGAAGAEPRPDGYLVPSTPMRSGLAAHMTRALAVPHAYVEVEVDASNLVKLRDGLKARYKARERVPLSYVAFVVKAAVEALTRNPLLNAHWTDEGLLVKRSINVGVAVALEDGLVVPVVRGADSLSIHGINLAIYNAATRARAGRLRVDDMGGGTFTVDNTGSFGSNVTLPTINVPEVAILTMETITKRAVVVETPSGDTIAVRPVMNMVLGFDHRANGGAQAGEFLRHVRRWLEATGPETAIY